MTRSQLLLVESNTTGTGRQFAARARDLGFEPVLVSADPGRYAYAAEDGLRTVLADTSDEAAVLAAARTLAERAPVAGVTSSSEYYVATAAATARALGLSGPSAQAVRDCRDKATQRRRLLESGVPVPRFAVVHDAEGALTAAASIGLPVVLKPVQGSGSLGVRLCGTAAEVAEHAAVLTTATRNERGLAAPSEILVEQYLTGHEFSVEVFGRTPVVTVAKHLGPLPAFVESGHDVPADLPADRTALLRDCAVRAVDALGLGWGAAHVELRLDGDDARVIEVNPRLAGGMIPELVRRSLGVDLVRAQVLTALGEETEDADEPRSSASIRFLTADRDGAVADADTAADAVAAARGLAGVVEVALYRAPGEPVAPAGDFRGRLGHVIAVSDLAAGAAQAVDRGLTSLRNALRYEEPEPLTAREPAGAKPSAAKVGA